MYTTAIVETPQRILNSEFSHSFTRIAITIRGNLFVVIKTTLRFCFGQRHKAITAAADGRAIRPALNTLAIEIDHSIQHFEGLWSTFDRRLNASE